MKKIFLLLILFVPLVVATNSCISEIVQDETEITPEYPEEPDVPILKTFYVNFLTSQIEQLTTYAYPYLGLSIPIIWWGSEERAGFFMFGDDKSTLYHNKPYFLNEDKTANGSRLAFLSDTVTTGIKNATCYGYYPYQSSISGTTVAYQLDSVQDQSADIATKHLMDESISPNLFMIAPMSESFVIKNGTGVLNFQTIFSILRFQVTRPTNMTTFNAQRIKRIRLYVAKKNDLSIPLDYSLAGDYTIDVSKSLNSSNYSGPDFNIRRNMVTATVTGGNEISEHESSSPFVWLIVNPVKINSDECFVSIVETDLYKIISTHDIPELKANNAYSIPIEAKNIVSDQVVVSYSLKNEAANCYIIPQAGVCQIPLYTINGKELRGKSVDWLWASKENGDTNFDIKELIDPSTFIYNESTTNEDNNYIRFRVGTDFGVYTKGNVILALKDANDAIVWTWHIWITDDLKDSPHENRLFLDRNIGAMSAQVGLFPIDNFGFVYQWGRKDPFIGGDGRTNENASTALSIARASTIVHNGDWLALAQTATVATAVKNPMTFYCNPTTLNNLNAPVDWSSDSNIPPRWSENSKTDQDPCPHGYRVPNRAELMVLHNGYLINNVIVRSFKSITPLYWEYTYNTVNTTVWPTAGMRQGRYRLNGNSGGRLLYSGTAGTTGQCFYWSSSSVVLNDNSVLSGGAYRIYTSGNLLYENEFGDNADAYPVRCIRME